MRILITGGCGFIGAWTARLLLEKGYEVISLDLSTESESTRDILGARASSVKWCEGDVTQYDAILSQARLCDAIVHLAGLLTPACQRSPVLGAQVNVIGALNAFEAAKTAGIRKVLYSSSVSVFGPENPSIPFPMTHYGAFKLAVEGCARAYHEDNHINSIGFRPAVVFGLGRKTGLTAGLTEACIAAAEGRPFEIGFSGSVPIVYVEDVARSLIDGLMAPVEGARVCNLVGEVVTVQHFVDEIRKIVPSADIRFSGPPVPFCTNGEVDPVSVSLPNFGYTPLADSVRMTIQSILFDRQS